MHHVAVTRFSDTTWQENEDWRKRHNWTGPAYGSPRAVSLSIPPGATVFVLEMHLGERKIKGIGLIRNEPARGHYRIYKEGNYNRYSYSSDYRIPREALTETELAHVCLLDLLLFRMWTLKSGRKLIHSMCGQGITVLPWHARKTCHVDFVQVFTDAFTSRWREAVPERIEQPERPLRLEASSPSS